MDAWNNTSMASGSPASSSSQLGTPGRVPDPDVAVTVAERAAHAVEQGAVGAVAIDVGRRQPRHGSGTAIGIVPQGEGGSIGKRAPEVRVDHLHPVTPPAQVKLVHHDRVQAGRPGRRTG